VEDPNERTIGVEMNGHVWDGSRWVPITPGRTPTRGAQVPPSGGSGGPPFQMWQRLPQPGGFTNPHYGYGFTRQTSDDLQFIARFIKIMIIIWVVSAILSIVLVPLLFGSLLAAIGSLVPHASR
jgi:hypothetical protein